jgi:hypothetical protein
LIDQLNIYRERIKRLEALMGTRISVKISDEDTNLRKKTKIVETWHNTIDERFHRIEFTVKDLKNVNRMLYDKIRYQENKQL